MSTFLRRARMKRRANATAVSECVTDEFLDDFSILEIHLIHIPLLIRIE
jgi:hypothetical protein